MTVNYTTNLSLGQPVTGTESGTWGDDVNNSVTSYLDIAIAGGLSIAITTADITLTLTQGTSSASNIVSTGATGSTAQYAILNITGAKTAARSLIVPSSSRHYVINNSAATGGFLLTVKGAATTGVTLVDGEKAIVAWNGSDYVKIASSSTTALTSGRVPYATTGGLLTDSANLLYSGTDLTVYGLTVGRGAGAVSTNTVVGASAFSSNTSGTNNTVIGTSAGASNTTGLYNTAVGDSSLNQNSTGSGNTVVGQGAMNTGLNGSYNTAIGYSAGNGSYGSTNTYLGKNSGSGMTSGSNNVIVGSFTGFGTPIFGTGSNWIVLSDGAGSVRQAIDSAGNAQFFSGALVVYAPAPTTISAATTLTNAQIQGQLIVTSGTSFTLTMPTGSTLNTLITWGTTNTGYDFSVINTASSTITMAVNTGVTSVGTLTVLTGISARFRIRSTGSSSYVLYRI
jgi:hypothetical protein